MNIEELNYNVHMQQSRAYYSQLEVALVHKLVYDFTASTMLMSSQGLSTRVVSL